MGQAIDDGYLVPYKIYKITTNLYKGGLRLSDAEEVIYDDEIDPSKIKPYYEPAEFEEAITIPDQINLLSKRVVSILDKTDAYGKTIVFCVDMIHAQQVKDALNRLKGNEEYATRIVAEDKDDMAKFRDRERPVPVIATTVDLLSTGIDIPHLQNIVFMRPIASKVLFKQIIGRGSRLFEGKGFFRIIDFTNATRLLDSWDLPPEPPQPPEEPASPYDKLAFGIVIDDITDAPIAKASIKIKVGRWNKEGVCDDSGLFKIFGVPSNETVRIIIEKDGYRNLFKRIAPQKSDTESPYEFRLKPERKKARKIKVKGVDVSIAEEVEIEFDGRKLSFAEYRKYTKDNIKETVHSTAELKDIWLVPDKKAWFMGELEKKNINISLIASIDNLEDSDSFDIIAHIAFDAPLLTREDRVKHFIRKNEETIAQHGSSIKDAVHDILDKYRFSGEDSLTAQVFMMPDMHSKKQEIQQNYPQGLSGFLNFVKDKIYSVIVG